MRTGPSVDPTEAGCSDTQTDKGRLFTIRPNPLATSDVGPNPNHYVLKFF